MCTHMFVQPQVSLAQSMDLSPPVLHCAEVALQVELPARAGAPAAEATPAHAQLPSASPEVSMGEFSKDIAAAPARVPSQDLCTAGRSLTPVPPPPIAPEAGKDIAAATAPAASTPDGKCACMRGDQPAGLLCHDLPSLCMDLILSHLLYTCDQRNLGANVQQPKQPAGASREGSSLPPPPVLLGTMAWPPPQEVPDGAMPAAAAVPQWRARARADVAQDVCALAAVSSRQVILRKHPHVVLDAKFIIHHMRIL